MKKQEVQWKPYNKDYEVSRDGQVRDRRTGRILKQYTRHERPFEPFVYIYGKELYVYRLASIAWLDRKDWDVEAMRGVKSNCKLVEEDVIFIRKHYNPKDKRYTQNALAKKFGVSKMTIKNIVQGKSWKNVM